MKTPNEVKKELSQLFDINQVFDAQKNLEEAKKILGTRKGKKLLTLLVHDVMQMAEENPQTAIQWFTKRRQQINRHFHRSVVFLLEKYLVTLEKSAEKAVRHVAPEKNDSLIYQMLQK